MTDASVGSRLGLALSAVAWSSLKGGLVCGIVGGIIGFFAGGSGAPVTAAGTAKGVFGVSVIAFILGFCTVAVVTGAWQTGKFAWQTAYPPVGPPPELHRVDAALRWMAVTALAGALVGLVLGLPFGVLAMSWSGDAKNGFQLFYLTLLWGLGYAAIGAAGAGLLGAIFGAIRGR